MKIISFIKNSFSPPEKEFNKLSKHKFIITSHGQTATRWLSAALNKHEDIFCVHGYTFPPVATADEDISNQEKVDIGQLAHNRFWKLNILDYLSELHSVQNPKFVGSVHAYMYGYLVNQIKKLNLTREIKNLTIMNMVRHPINRIESAYKCWTVDNKPTSESTFVDYDFNNNCTPIIKHLNSIKKEFSNLDKYFIVALYQAQGIAEDVKKATSDGIYQIRYEDLISNPTVLTNIISMITNNVVKLTPSEADNLFNTKRINQHNTAEPLAVKDQFQRWQPWQQIAYTFIHQNEKFEEVYSPFDYDFSFIQ